MMQKWIPVLGGLLLAQLVLALALNMTSEDYRAFEAEEPLITFERAAVDALRIDDGTASLLLNKQQKVWVLPATGDLPAGRESVEQLLDKLAGLKRGWPVATTAGAVRRFKVDAEQFERKLTLMSGETPLAELYVGTSPGFRKVHVRPADAEAVFAVTFDSWEASAEADDWIDKALLSLDAADVERIEMPGFVLQRQEEGLVVAGLGAGEQTHAKQAESLVSALAGLRIQGVPAGGTEAGGGEPAFELQVALKEGEPLTYRFSALKEGGDYLLERSDFEQRFRVAEFSVKPLQEAVREKLVVTEAEEPAQASEQDRPEEERQTRSEDAGGE